MSQPDDSSDGLFVRPLKQSRTVVVQKKAKAQSRSARFSRPAVGHYYRSVQREKNRRRISKRRPARDDVSGSDSNSETDTQQPFCLWDNEYNRTHTSSDSSCERSMTMRRMEDPAVIDFEMPRLQL